MKVKITVGILLMLLGVSVLTMPVIAQVMFIPWQPERAQFDGSGWVVCDEGMGLIPPEIEGDRCYFEISGRKTPGTWTGHGLWIDEDWDEGVLIAILTVKDQDILFCTLLHDPEPGHISDLVGLYGKALVFINGKFQGRHEFGMTLWDAESGTNPSISQTSVQADLISLYMWSDPEDIVGSMWYGTGQPELESGDIWTWWYPEYSEV